MTHPSEAGFIDGIAGRSVYGWHVCPPGTRSALRVNGARVYHLPLTVSRADVAQQMGLDSDIVGFDLRLSSDFFNGQPKMLELLSVRDDAVSVICERLLEVPDRVGAQLNVDSRAPDSSAAVICWDLAHNPAGRALVLRNILQNCYEQVDLIGPIHARFGSDLWAPLREMPGLSVITADVQDFQDLSDFAGRMAKRKYDFLWICKPRFPSMYIAMRMLEQNRTRVALDIDDYEMSFYPKRLEHKRHPNTLQGLESGALHPADFDATVLAHQCIDNFTMRTVSNKALQRMYGGMIVPHGRPAAQFDPKVHDRAAKRAELGIEADAKVVCFIGTIRRHKGVPEIARAVANCAAQGAHFLVAGTYEDNSLKDELREICKDRCTLLDIVPFNDLPALLAAADVIFLQQDPSSLTSHYQLPAKLIDGLSMGLKVIVNDLGAFDGMQDVTGLFLRSVEEPMDQALRRVLATPVATEAVRDGFVRRFSCETLAAQVQATLETLSAEDCIDAPDQLSARILNRSLQAGMPTFKTRTATRAAPRDLVILWKQQDSGLFGRRVDMLARYLKQSGRFDRIICIDAPMSVSEYKDLERRAVTPGFGNARLIHDALVRRVLGMEENGEVIRFNCLSSTNGETVLGRKALTRDNLHKAYRAFFDRIKLSRDALLWICPVVLHVDQVLRAHEFRWTVADLIDDEREFTQRIETRVARQMNYVQVLGNADAVFTNNDDMADRFQGYSDRTIHVVPNGVERADFGEDEILHLSGLIEGEAVLGYVGNLRDRVDTALLTRLAKAADNWRVVLVGPTGGNPEVEALARLPKLTLAGVVDYEQSRRIAAGFDVALIPHALDSLTDSMNPLKFFLYKELGLPIVTTPVKNLGKANDQVYVARPDDPEDFLAQVRAALKGRSGRKRQIGAADEDELWQARAAEVLRLLNAQLPGFEQDTTTPPSAARLRWLGKAFTRK